MEQTQEATTNGCMDEGMVWEHSDVAADRPYDEEDSEDEVEREREREGKERETKGFPRRRRGDLFSHNSLTR